MGACKVLVLEDAHRQLEELQARDHDLIVERMSRLAAQEDHPLDRTTPTTRFSPDLRHVRKMRIGLHRVYFFGKGSQCTYRLAWVKANKKSGVDDEDERAWQRKLVLALQRPATGVLAEP